MPDTMLPRRETDLTPQQELFVAEYLTDFDRDRALKAAGYHPTTPESSAAMSSRLLASVKIRAFLWEKKAEIVAERKLDAVKWLAQLQLVAMEAYENQDWAGAVAALREIGKYGGWYEKDNRQKHFTAEDADKLRADLEARGFDFRRANAPTVLVNDAEAPVVIPPPPENP